MGLQGFLYFDYTNLANHFPTTSYSKSFPQIYKWKVDILYGQVFSLYLSQVENGIYSSTSWKQIASI